jgi:dimeric dUTPase (all-alpha-NTP-PPase superfamily)
MSKLEKLLYLQDKLDHFIMTERNLTFTTDTRLQGLVVAIESEIDEVRKGLNWKWWKNPKVLDIEYLKEEWIDILHFWLSGCNTLGMDANEILTRYINKNKENFKRQTGEVNKDDGAYILR